MIEFDYNNLDDLKKSDQVLDQLDHIFDGLKVNPSSSAQLLVFSSLYPLVEETPDRFNSFGNINSFVQTLQQDEKIKKTLEVWKKVLEIDAGRHGWCRQFSDHQTQPS